MVTIHHAQLRQLGAESVQQVQAGLVNTEPAAGQPALAQRRGQDAGHETADQLALLHDRDGVHGTEPGHEGRVVDLAARAHQDRWLALHQQRGVENSVLARQDLGPQ